MKKTIFKTLIAMLFLTMLGNDAVSQPLFGYTPSEVRSEFPNASWTYDKWGDNKDMLMMSYSTQTFEVSYLFNQNNKSVFTSISPTKQGTLQYLIETYNNRYVIISNTKWKLYKGGSIFVCELLQKNDGSYFFFWTLEE